MEVVAGLEEFWCDPGSALGWVPIGPTLAVEHPETALDEARTKALAKARARADLYAKAAGLSVRRIVRISESDIMPPPPRPMAMMAAKRAEDTPLEAGEQELTVNLSVVFELN